MRSVTLVGHDFDFSGNDGISRYSMELYRNMQKESRGRFSIRTVEVAKRPNLLRTFAKLKVDGDIAHLMYPNPGAVDKGRSSMVITWHDNRVFNRTEEHGSLSLSRYRAHAVKKVALDNYKQSDAVISVSSLAADELRSYLKRHEMYDKSKKYFTINEGVDDLFLDAKVWHGARRNFGYIGSIHARHKNLPGLLEAFDGIVEESSDSKLHIFTMSDGADAVLAEAMKGFDNLSKWNVLLHKRESDAEILKYLSRFVACLHLSLKEGFGLPILESLAAGTPVITLKGAEIPDETARYTVKSDKDEVVKRALKMIDAQRPADSRAVKYAKGFTWRKTAQKTLSVYERVL